MIYNGRLSGLITAAVLLLIASIAVKCACTTAGGGSNGSTFQCVAGLMADDAASSGSKQATSDRSALGVRPGRGCTV